MENLLRIAIVGSRNFDNFELFEKKWDELVIENNWTEEKIKIISGGAKGVDSLARLLSVKKVYFMKEFIPDWHDFSAHPCKIRHRNGVKFNVLAGFNRNTKIVQGCDILVAFWDMKSKGTKDSIDKAKKMKKDVIIIDVNKLRG